MINKEIKDLINQIEGIMGPCIYDEDDAEYGDLVLWPKDYMEVGIEISIETYHISIFASFSYIDFNNEDLKSGNYDTEEIEREISTKLLESSFAMFLKAHSPCYDVSIWDDGGYMCPGYVARVGYQDMQYTDLLLNTFCNLFREFSSKYNNLSDYELWKYIFISICRRRGINVRMGEKLTFGDATVRFCEDKNSLDTNIEHYYIGKGYFLLETAHGNYATNALYINIFLEACDECELFDEITYYLEDPPLFAPPTLIVRSKHMEMRIGAICDKTQMFANAEESIALMSYNSFMPFATEKFRETFYAAYSKMMDMYSGPEPIIITEGTTDWKHLKKFWNQFLQNKIKISFHEFEPPDSDKDTPFKQDMGSRALLTMCQAYSRMKHEKKLIFIADRDEKKIVDEMDGGLEEYKKWGNNVYSFALPIPTHRMESPDICIEHLYSDEEIRTVYMCNDGVERRLFLGNDFDEYGRNIDEGLMCIKRNLCGPDSIKVIDGSSDMRVISMKEKNNINYALSKQKFEEFSVISKDSPTYYAFLKVFSIIQSIIEDTQ